MMKLGDYRQGYMRCMRCLVSWPRERDGYTRWLTHACQPIGRAS